MSYARSKQQDPTLTSLLWETPSTIDRTYQESGMGEDVDIYWKWVAIQKEPCGSQDVPTIYCWARGPCQAVTMYWEYPIWSLKVQSMTAKMSSDYIVLKNKIKRHFKRGNGSSDSFIVGCQPPVLSTPSSPSRCQLLPSAREWDRGMPRKCSHKMHVAIMPSAPASSLHLVVFLSKRKWIKLQGRLLPHFALWSVPQQ